MKSADCDEQSAFFVYNIKSRKKHDRIRLKGRKP